MNILRETVLPLFALLFAVLCVAGVMTAATLIHDQHVCIGNGGHYSIEGSTAWCRY